MTFEFRFSWTSERLNASGGKSWKSWKLNLPSNVYTFSSSSSPSSQLFTTARSFPLYLVCASFRSFHRPTTKGKYVYWISTFIHFYWGCQRVVGWLDWLEALKTFRYISFYFILSFPLFVPVPPLQFTAFHISSPAHFTRLFPHHKYSIEWEKNDDKHWKSVLAQSRYSIGIGSVATGKIERSSNL